MLVIALVIVRGGVAILPVILCLAGLDAQLLLRVDDFVWLQKGVAVKHDAISSKEIFKENDFSINSFLRHVPLAHLCLLLFSIYE